MFTMFQGLIAGLARLCILVAGTASVMYALNGTGPEEPVLERGGTTPEPLVRMRRSDAVFPGQC